MLTKTRRIIKKIAFFGDADIKKNDDNYKLAFDTAKLLAENGFTLINGGGPGIMQACTEGAKAGNGSVELVVLDPKNEPDNYEGENRENISLADKVTVTKDYPSRLNKLIKISDAFVIFNGGTGTISEVGMTWEIAKFDYGDHKPLIFMGESWREIINTMTRDLNLEKKEQKVVALVNTPEEVLDIVMKGKQTKRVGVLERFFKFIEKI
jgi:uncharacterized protein (TIGR00725 family)